jgi:hypothetical protein
MGGVITNKTIMRIQNLAGCNKQTGNQIKIKSPSGKPAGHYEQATDLNNMCKTMKIIKAFH